jgi:ubiquinone/menaquinone biosynthesis C-methylase UbiE
VQHAYFDNYAVEYDAHFSMGVVGLAQRNIVHKYLQKILSKEKKVLEINCGTGEDALFMSPRCKEVVGTDISGEMIRVAQKKIQNLNNCKLSVLPIQRISSLDRKFDLIFSNFGGLNCLNQTEIKNFARDSSRLLENGSELVLVIMGRKCIWETFYFWFKGESLKARRRRQESVKAEVSGSEFEVYYYSPREIKELFNDQWLLVSVRPIGFFIPPSFLDPFFTRHKLIFFILRFMDSLVSHLSFLSNYADHYLIHLERK